MELIMNDELVDISYLNVTNESDIYYTSNTTLDDLCEENVLEDDIENWSLDEFSTSFPKDIYEPYRDEIYGLSMIWDIKELLWKVGYVNYGQYLLYAENVKLQDALKELQEKRENLYNIVYKPDIE